MPPNVSDLDRPDEPTLPAAPAQRVQATLEKRGIMTAVDVPCASLRGVARVGESNPPVIAEIGGRRWESTLAPGTPGTLRLIVPAAVRLAAGVGVGEVVTITLRRDTDRKAPPLPSELAAALARRIGGREAFEVLNVAGQRPRRASAKRP